MSLREIIKIFPQYRIYKSLAFPKRFYAVLETEVEKIEILRKRYSNIDHHIPDSFTVKALPLITADNDFYTDFDHHPTRHRVNDLIEEVFEDAKI